MAYLGMWAKQISMELRLKEICLIIEGQAKISTQNGDIFMIKAGDLVEFPAGLNCEWEVTKSIKKIIEWVAKFKKKDFFFLYC